MTESGHGLKRSEPFEQWHQVALRFRAGIFFINRNPLIQFGENFFAENARRFPAVRILASNSSGRSCATSASWCFPTQVPAAIAGRGEARL